MLPDSVWCDRRGSAKDRAKKELAQRLDDSSLLPLRFCASGDSGWRLHQLDYENLPFVAARPARKRTGTAPSCKKTEKTIKAGTDLS
jgi:hypothetical protein